MTAGPDETRSEQEREAIWDDVHAELSLALGIDDSDDGWVDAKNAATDAIMRLFDRELAAARAEADRLREALSSLTREELDERLCNAYPDAEGFTISQVLDFIASILRAALAAGGSR